MISEEVVAAAEMRSWMAPSRERILSTLLDMYAAIDVDNSVPLFLAFSIQTAVFSSESGVEMSVTRPPSKRLRRRSARSLMSAGLRSEVMIIWPSRCWMALKVWKNSS